MFFARALIVSVAVLLAGTALAQDRGKSEGACGRDASRFCKKVINDGDMVILDCLKQNRAKISKACQQMLASHGQ